jgi:uncharacterized membrane protein YtjA (UPF0391 family)
MNYVEQFRHLSVLNVTTPVVSFYVESDMLRAAVIFLVLAIIAGVFGFGGIASASAGMAKIVFGIFLLLFFISALAGALKGRVPD